MTKLIKRYQTGGGISNTGASSTAANYSSLFGKGGFSGINGIGNIMGMSSDIIGSFIPSRSEYSGQKGTITQGLDSVYDTAANTVSSVSPLAGGIMKRGAMLGKAVGSLGGGTDGMTTTDSILGSSFFNLSPIGLINGFGGKRTNTLTQGQGERDAIANVGSSYGGTLANWQDAAAKSHKKYGAFSSGSRRKANRQINKAENQMNTMQNISTTSEIRNLLANYMGDKNNQTYQFNLQRGYNPRTQIGKFGIKIKDLNRAKNIVKLSKGKKQDIKKAKEGLKLEEKEFKPNGEWSPRLFQNGGDINVIPEGALHARKNNMETPNITKKGIPVIDNDGKQQAEIERNEIIFRKEVTDKIEKLSKDGSDDAAIECGKLLASEIFENTEDRTGLIKEVISAKTGTKLDIPKIDASKLTPPEAPNTGISPEIIESVNKEIDNKALQQGINKNTLINGAIDTVGNIAKVFNTPQKVQKQQEITPGNNMQQQQYFLQQKELLRTQNPELYKQYFGTQVAEKGTKLTRKYKTYEEWKDYLNSTNRQEDPNYDNKGFYDDDEAYNNWQEEEERSPGKAHFIDKYKLPSFMTFSTDSKYNDKDHQGGSWSADDEGDIFITSPYLEKIHSLQDYLNWLPIHDNSIKNIIYKGTKYHIGRKNK